MSVEKVEALVVGAGQAGVAMSEHLSQCGVPHLVLERHRIAERWRSERWDSLVANGPAWHDRFPGLEFSDVDPDAFVPKEQVADYFVAYAEKIAAPIRCGVEVQAGAAATSAGPASASRPRRARSRPDYVVAATGPFQRPVIPPIVPEDAGIMQMHSSAYRNPGQLPAGAVLVVGAGVVGRADRRRAAAGGPARLPLGRARTTVRRGAIAGATSSGGSASSASGTPRPAPASEHVTIAVSGAYGGHTVDFRRLAAQGMTLRRPDRTPSRTA